MNYTNRQYWDNYWENERRGGYNFYFSELIDDYIPWDDVYSYMEIGGAPGNICAYMHNVHGLKCSIVDFTNPERIENYLKQQGVVDCNVFTEDFAVFNAEKYSKSFDIVASWGFVEHFERDVTAEYIEKKKKMVADDGYLIIELPNIRKIFWLAYWLFNRDLIKIHNLEIMDIDWLKEQVSNGGKFEILYASYYMSMNEQNEFFSCHPRLLVFCKKLIAFFRNRKLHNRLKRWFYPYIIIVAKKKL